MNNRFFLMLMFTAQLSAMHQSLEQQLSSLCTQEHYPSQHCSLPSDDYRSPINSLDYLSGSQEWHATRVKPSATEQTNQPQSQSQQQSLELEQHNAGIQTDGTSAPQAFFSPGVKAVLLQLITSEQQSIHGAYYRFTLYDIAQALCDRHDTTNMPISLCVDAKFQEDFCAGLRLLTEHGIPIFCNTPRYADSHNFEIMHHKFFIFGNNQLNKGSKLLCIGSFNATGQADKNNWENFVVISDQETIERFEKELENLHRHTRPITREELVCKNHKSDYARRMNCIPDTEAN